jgi:hypothetical protein
VRNRILYVDLTALAAIPDPEVPLAGTAAAEALGRSIRANFPRLRETVVSIDGQAPHAPREKKI